jgi:hypothetical protein
VHQYRQNSVSLCLFFSASLANLSPSSKLPQTTLYHFSDKRQTSPRISVGSASLSCLTLPLTVTECPHPTNFHFPRSPNSVHKIWQKQPRLSSESVPIVLVADPSPSKRPVPSDTVSLSRAPRTHPSTPHHAHRRPDLSATRTSRSGADERHDEESG